MSRPGSLSLFGFTLIAFAISNASPPDDTKFNNALSVQAAMVRARGFLTEMQTQKAVDVLEDQLPKVNNNPQYLSLLRDAYRSYIRDLHLAGQPDLARRYFERLCILDPEAANDPTLRPQTETALRKFEQAPVKEKKTAFPTFKLPGFLPNPFAKTEEPKGPPPKATIRAHAESSIVEDPFERKHQREMPIDSSKAVLARELLTRGAGAFMQKRYAEARICFEQAYQTEPGSLEACREQWAYCILNSVAVAMEQPGILPARLPELQKQVDGAIQMAPTKMMAIGQDLLQRLEQRAKAGGPALTSSVRDAVPLAPLARNDTPPHMMDGKVLASHLGKNREGWEVTKTKHFLIFHKKDIDLAERVAGIAEATRAAMYRKWFTSEGVEWDPVCELILHPSGDSYTHMTGQPSNSPGHAKMESDRSGRVIARRMDLRHDLPGMIEAVLPHETTHVVLAGMFDAHLVPRWADEGIAVLSEPNEKIDTHRRNLLKHHGDGHLFALKDLMEMKDYPHPRRIGAFYSQSVVLVEFLVQQKNPKVFTDFVRDGLRHGYDTSLQRHYGMTFTQLDQLWQQQVISNTERFAARK